MARAPLLPVGGSGSPSGSPGREHVPYHMQPHRALMRTVAGFLTTGALLALLVVVGSSHQTLRTSADNVIRRISDCSEAATGDLPAIVYRLLLPTPTPQQDPSQAAPPATAGVPVPDLASIVAARGVLTQTLQLDRFGYDLEAYIRQQVYCQEAFPPSDPVPAVQFDAGGRSRGGGGLGSSMVAVELRDDVNMYVYSGADIVSSSIRGGNSWEPDGLQEVVWAMAQPLPARQRGAARVETAADGASVLYVEGDSSGPPVSSGPLAAALAASGPLFVDVGANVGWFAVNVAAHGYPVAAFEGMASNVRLIRNTLCASPGLAGRLVLHAFGLGQERSACYIFSDDKNRGDGITLCGVSSREEAASKVRAGYALRGELPIRRLDDVIRQDIKVLKMDVEGYEPSVMAGARGLLAPGGRYRAWYINTEYNPIMLRGVSQQQDPIKLLTNLQDWGYRVSITSFRGPWLSREAILALAQATHTINVYAAHQDLFAPTAEAAAPVTAAAAARAEGSSGRRR